MLDTLRLGAHQLLGMRVPRHAAVDETVALARQVNGAGAAGFVNAVMRRISEREPDEWVELVTAGVTDPVERLAAAHVPPGLDRQGPPGRAHRPRRRRPGRRRGVADRAPRERQRAGQGVARRAPRPRRRSTSSSDAGAERSGLSPVGAVLPEGDPGAIAAVRDGRAAVQDEGSQLLVLALAAADVEGEAAEHERWLDLCAGPGGKAGLLAALAIERRIPFVANEISEHRADLVWQTLRPRASRGARAGHEPQGAARRRARARRGRARRHTAACSSTHRAPVSGRCGVVPRRAGGAAPATWPPWPGCSASCSSPGIEATAPGGLVGYATCSPHLNETRFVVTDILKRRDDVELVDARPLFVDASGRELPGLGDGPYVQLWPHVHGTDAMFFALLRKR